MKTGFKILAAVIVVFVIVAVGVVADANIRISNEETISPGSGAPGRFVLFEGRKLHVATIGELTADPSGAPLLLIHGFAAPGHVTWLPWATRLTSHRALILPDLLGFGHSERVNAPGSHYTLKNRAASLAAILDALNVIQVDIVGESYGGAVAAQFALDYPTRVRRIIFMDAAIYPRPISGAWTGELPLGIGRAVSWHVLAGGPFGFIAQNCRNQRNCRWMRLARVQGTTDALRAMSATQRSPEAVGDQALPKDVVKITAPSLVIWGGDDTLVPVADGDRLARDLKTNIAIIADAGHMPYLDQPERVARRVLEFLAPSP